MKSSTLRRANLSKEKLQVLETLAKYRRQGAVNNDGSFKSAIPAKQMKERELDMLWDNFKQHNKAEKSPTVYLVAGFVAGVIITAIVTIFIQMSMTSMSENANDISQNVPETKIEDTAITFIPADKTGNSKNDGATAATKEESYTVQNGDTLESIIIRFYGAYSVEHEKAIKDANHLANPNALSIGQKLVIPLH